MFLIKPRQFGIQNQFLRISFLANMHITSMNVFNKEFAFVVSLVKMQCGVICGASCQQFGVLVEVLTVVVFAILMENFRVELIYLFHCFFISCKLKHLKSMRSVFYVSIITRCFLFLVMLLHYLLILAKLKNVPILILTLFYSFLEFHPCLE